MSNHTSRPTFRLALRALRRASPSRKAAAFAATLTLGLAVGLLAVAQTQNVQAQTAQPQIPPRPVLDTPAKELFSQVKTPAQMKPQAIGFYSRGCLAGGQALPATGPEQIGKDEAPLWQVMRLSRNRYYGHPELIEYVEKLATKVPKVSDWNGILVGDLSQPRGGPVMSGHASHQVGLDVDIWLTPGPKKQLTSMEREKLSASPMVRQDRRDIDPKNWTPDHWKIIRAAAEDPRVERIFVNAAIKKALCRETQGNRNWLSKVRPYWGHDHHMHVRLSCPTGSPNCRPQKPVSQGNGCGAELAWWFTDEVLNPKPEPAPTTPAKPKPEIMLDDLPRACAVVLDAP